MAEQNNLFFWNFRGNVSISKMVLFKLAFIWDLQSNVKGHGNVQLSRLLRPVCTLEQKAPQERWGESWAVVMPEWTVLGKYLKLMKL